MLQDPRISIGAGLSGSPTDPPNGAPSSRTGDRDSRRYNPGVVFGPSQVIDLSVQNSKKSALKYCYSTGQIEAFRARFEGFELADGTPASH
jgi:hypothetical protein